MNHDEVCPPALFSTPESDSVAATRVDTTTTISTIVRGSGGRSTTPRNDGHQKPGTALDGLVRETFGGRPFCFVEYLDDRLGEDFDVKGFAEKHQLTADYGLVEGIVALLRQEQASSPRSSPTTIIPGPQWKDAVDVYLEVRRGSRTDEETDGGRTREKTTCRKRKVRDRSNGQSSGAGGAASASRLSSRRNRETRADDDARAEEPTDSIRHRHATISLRDMNFSETTADMAVYEMEVPRERTNTRKQRSGSKIISRPQQQGSLEKLVAKEYDGNFSRFLEEVEGEMRLATFSFSGFVRRKGVPKARETLRNITCYLSGEPTKQFLAEVWKTRICDYLNSKGLKDPDGCDHVNEAGNHCSKSNDLEEPHNSIAPKDVTTDDVTASRKRGKLRGREGALDRLVMDEFEGDFFGFLALVEREMVTPGFTATGFTRKLRVPGGRETLRHIVSHLKGDLLTSDQYLAQMWKDRIRVYRQSKLENVLQSSESVNDSEEWRLSEFSKVPV